jgi:iron complex outermembrane receptor protein
MSALLLASLLAVAAPLPAAAQEVHAFDVPAPDPASAIRAFGDQAGLQILAAADDLKDKKFNPVNGDISTEEALTDLLAGTGLDHRYVGDHAVALVSNSSAAAVAPSETSPTASSPSGDQPASQTDGKSKQDEAKKGFWDRFRLAQADQGTSASASSVEKEKDQNSKKKADQLEEVVVTGSRIPRTAQEGAQEVKIYTAEQIEQSGQTTVADFFSTLPDVSVAMTENNPILGLVPGSTTVQLHGLPIGTTLVLINGRRVEVSGSQGSNGSNFFDLNSIPLSAVDRIEVVSEGSSAVYGSDAIAGVINVILKKHFIGVEANAKYGWASGTDETDASIAWGQRWDKGAFSFIGSYQTRSELTGFERGITASDNKIPFGGQDNRLGLCNPGNVFFPKGFSFNGQPPVQFAAVPAGFTGTPSIQEFSTTAGTLNKCDIGGYSDLIPASHRVGMFASGNLYVTPSVEIFGELMYSYVQQLTEGNPPAAFAVPGFSVFTASASNPYNPFNQTVGVGYLFSDIGRQKAPVNTAFVRPLIGVRGTLFDSWHWELAGWDAQDRSEYTLTNSLNAGAAQTALDSADPRTALNVFTAGEAGSAALIQSLIINQRQYFRGQTAAVNGFLQGPVFTLPSGSVDLVIGTEYDSDKLHFDQVNITGVPPNTQATYNRDQYAFFSEARFPLLRDSSGSRAGDTLAVTLAGRYDHYAGFGNKTTPQFGIEWRPFDTLLLRGTYAHSFKAPGLFNLFEPPSTFQSAVSDPKLGNQFEGVNVTTGGNPSLQPETGKSRTYGLVYSSKVIPDLQLSVTHWEVDENNSIQQADLQVLANNESLFPGAIVRAPGVGGEPGPITQINDTFVNFGAINVEGLDFRVNYKVATDWGTIIPSLSATDTYRYTTALIPGTPATNRTSRANDDGNFAPRWKATAGLGWSFGPYAVNVDGRYVGHYQDYDSANEIGNFWLYDGHFSYAIGQALSPNNRWLKDASIVLGGVNIFNTLPQFSNFDFGHFGYDPAEGDIRGRFLYIQIKTKM